MDRFSSKEDVEMNFDEVAFEEGREDRRNGLKLDSNPWSTGWMQKSWQAGWLDEDMAIISVSEKQP